MTSGVVLIFLVFAGDAVVSGFVTLVVMWGGNGALRTRLAQGAGFLSGLPMVRYLWQYDEPQVPHNWLDHRTFAVAALAAAIAAPWWVIGQINDPRYPNENWMPPRKRAQAQARAANRDRASAAGGERNDEPHRAQFSQAHRDAGAGQGHGSNHRHRQWFRPATAQMAAEEAWQVLGLEPGASPDEIREAHRRLMMKLHPDVGGSNYLASKVNEARDVLLDD
jgi:hypothetical protein